MGVVRREGDWRLEKKEAGLYEVTYEQTIEATITTPDYDPGVFDDRYAVGVPVHEVGSYSEAEAVFEEMASKGTMSTRGGFDPPANPVELGYDSSTGDESLIEEMDHLPPGGFVIVSLLTGGIVIYSSAFEVGSPAFYLGGALLLGGLGVLGWAVILYKTKGANRAWEFLTTTEDTDSKSSASDAAGDDPERTPPAPQSLKDDLYFGRADQRCEWCDERVDQPEVHHIKPRSEGGPNERSNLIVLCPGCHAKADRGAISRTKLRSKLRHLAETPDS